MLVEVAQVEAILQNMVDNAVVSEGVAGHIVGLLRLKISGFCLLLLSQNERLSFAQFVYFVKCAYFSIE